MITFLFISMAGGYAYEYDPNDFAAEVVSYIQGTGVTEDYIDGSYFNQPDTALGRPTVDTTGDDPYGYGIDPSEAVPVDLNMW